MSSSPKILLTGATGYIGGSILTHIINSTHPALKNATITTLVRGEDRVATLKATYGDRVNPVLYKDLDDTDPAVAVASEHDIVINTTNGYHASSAAALVQGLAARKKQTGKDVWMIHTSGTSNLADQPITKHYLEADPAREFDDSKDDIYGYEKERNARDPYPQRTNELGVIDAGLETGVRTLVIMSPLIYGKGSGAFNKFSIQIPSLVAATLKGGYGFVVGNGEGVWDHVHVEDLAELYTLALFNILEKSGEDVPVGKEGIIFSANGREGWKGVAEKLAEAAFVAGKIESKEVKEVGLQEAADVVPFAAGQLTLMELALTSNSRTKSVVGREKLGWKPTRGEEAWKKEFKDAVEA
ncbi:hypothetical protein BDV97DRAFT_300645 [Delphinella strobiligena]|nr:hypothetical protein BDV97DRAFT_300645 [Delphinella strobiligena]